MLSFRVFRVVARWLVSSGFNCCNSASVWAIFPLDSSSFRWRAVFFALISFISLSFLAISLGSCCWLSFLLFSSSCTSFNRFRLAVMVCMFSYTDRRGASASRVAFTSLNCCLLFCCSCSKNNLPASSSHSFVSNCVTACRCTLSSCCFDFSFSATANNGCASW